MQNHSYVVLLTQTEDDAGGTNGEEGAVGDDATLAVAEDLVVNKGTGIAGAVAQNMAQTAFFVARHLNDTMANIDAGVNGFDGGVATWIAFHVAAYDVVAHAERNDLLVVENVLNDHNGAAAVGFGILVGILFFLGVAEFGNAHADAKLLVAFGTLEHQRLPRLILGFIEGDEIVAFGTSYSLHGFSIFMTHASAKGFWLLSW